MGIPYIVANWGNELMHLFDDGHSYHTTHEKTVKKFEALRDEGFVVYLSSDFCKFETAQGPALFRALHNKVLSVMYETFRPHLLRLGYDESCID